MSIANIASMIENSGIAGVSLADNAAPALRYIEVTADDDDDLPDGVCRGLLVQTAGVASLHEFDGTVRLLVPLQAGYNPMFVRRVLADGILAAGIWALY